MQAEEAGRKVAALGLAPDSLAFVSSPLARTRETMDILRATMGLPPGGYRFDPGFAELGFGDWEGLTWREIRHADPDRSAARKRDKWGYVPPGGGESYAMLAVRVSEAVARLDGPTLLVAHGGVARALLHLLAGVSRQVAPQTDIWQGRVLVLEDGRHEWV